MTVNRKLFVRAEMRAHYAHHTVLEH